MTLSESAINEILAVINEGGGADLVRQLAQFGIQELIEAEATEAIGAAAWERSPERVTHRNGHRPRVWSTTSRRTGPRSMRRSGTRPRSNPSPRPVGASPCAPPPVASRATLW